MTWREDLRRVTVGGRKLVGASFRGVPFFVETSERSGGRRAVVHEFPLRDEPYVEDLGRRARPFRVDGYVVGDDYLTQRDALLAALEDVAGPGELVHPYHGVLRAACINVAVRESRAEGGMATFAIEFVQAPAVPPAPVEVVDEAGQVATRADAAVTSSAAELDERYSAARLPAFALESARLAITRAAAAVGEKLGPVAATAQELAELTSAVALLTAQASSLARQPAEAISGLRSAIVGMVNTLVASPGAVMDALVEAYFADLGTPVDPITSTRERELANQEALIGGIRRMLAIESARLAPLAAYASIDEATAARDQVAELLEEQAAVAGDTAYPAIVDLRSEVLRSVPGGRAFARVVDVTRNIPIPSLLLAYQLYGEVDLEADLVARNGIRHPGFVAGNLKALSDG